MVLHMIILDDHLRPKELEIPNASVLEMPISIFSHFRLTFYKLQVLLLDQSQMRCEETLLPWGVQLNQEEFVSFACKYCGPCWYYLEESLLMNI